jgi:hypothetical protein
LIELCEITKEDKSINNKNEDTNIEILAQLLENPYDIYDIIQRERKPSSKLKDHFTFLN